MRAGSYIKEVWIRTLHRTSLVISITLFKVKTLFTCEDE